MSFDMDMRISLAVKWLNRKKPGWVQVFWESMSIRRGFDLQSEYYCVLGHVFGDYYDGMKALFTFKLQSYRHEDDFDPFRDWNENDVKDEKGVITYTVTMSDFATKLGFTVYDVKETKTLQKKWMKVLKELRKGNK